MKVWLDPGDPLATRLVWERWLYRQGSWAAVSGTTGSTCARTHCSHPTGIITLWRQPSLKFLTTFSTPLIKATVLISLYLSAAFNTIDHSILISRVEYTLSLDSLAREWVWPYLSGWTSFVKISWEWHQISAVILNGSASRLHTMTYNSLHSSFHHSAMSSLTAASSSTNMAIPGNIKLHCHEYWQHYYVNMVALWDCEFQTWLL